MSNMLKYIEYCTSFVLFEHKLNVDGGLGERRQKHTIIETKQGTWRKMQLWSSGRNRTYASAILEQCSHH